MKRKLTHQQITFIDNYLKNSGIRYTDIRYEMTDHVAAELENMDGDFYDNFREYMLRHKAGILQSNKKFAKNAQNRAIHMVLTRMVKPLSIFLFVVLFALLTVFCKYFDKEAIGIINLLYFFTSACIIFFYKFIKKLPVHKFSVIDRLLNITLFVTYILFIVLHPEKIISNQILLIAFYSLFGPFVCATIFTFNQLYNKYRLMYNG